VEQILAINLRDLFRLPMKAAPPARCELHAERNELIGGYFQPGGRTARDRKRLGWGSDY